MPDRLSALDASFLHLEHSTALMHVGSVLILQPSRNLDVDHLIRHIEARIAYVPRYRQRLLAVPGRLANPVWVDDEHFDLNYHIRRSALPRPGGEQQLTELVARLLSRRLDRRRPLWELTVVEGLEGDRCAVVTKTHQAMVDGIATVDLAHVLLDPSPEPVGPPPLSWQPAPQPSGLELLAGAFVDGLRRPGIVLQRLRTSASDVGHTAARVARTLGDQVLSAGSPTPRLGALAAEASEHRRFAILDSDLADYRRIRAHLAGGAGNGPTVTVNDVVLATLAGGLRAWLMTRGEATGPGTFVRTLVPMSVRDDAPASSAVAGRVSSVLVDLPTGEPSPLMRLHQISYQTTAHRETGRSVDAPALTRIAGFAPPTLHSLGLRLATGLARRTFHLVVTNVPGPQQPLYLDGSRLLGAYPVVPLLPGQLLGVGVTSYDGAVYYGLTADRDAIPDLEVVAQCVSDALTELLEAVT